MRKRHKDYLEEQFEISNPIKKWKILKDLINKTDHWRIEGGAKGALPPPLKLVKVYSKLEVADQQGVVNSRS